MSRSRVVATCGLVALLVGVGLAVRAEVDCVSTVKGVKTVPCLSGDLLAAVSGNRPPCGTFDVVGTAPNLACFAPHSAVIQDSLVSVSDGPFECDGGLRGGGTNNTRLICVGEYTPSGDPVMLPCYVLNRCVAYTNPQTLQVICQPDPGQATIVRKQGLRTVDCRDLFEPPPPGGPIA